MFLSSVNRENLLMMSSADEDERETLTIENRKESGRDDAVCQRLKSKDERTTTRDTDSESEEFISVSVGDGRYLVDLGSSSEFVVDEECLLQLFKSCRECNRQCRVNKQVEGLKLVVSQKCCFCESSYEWTNLPDNDGDLQRNKKD